MSEAIAEAGAVSAEATPRADLGAAEREELRQLLGRHFHGVTERQFERDLDEKDWVLRLRREDRLVGFSTLQTYATRFDDRPVNVVYSGDTITDPDAWGTPVLARAWIAMVRRAQGERAGEPWYWFLLTSGYRTYRFLPVFWKEFWPRHDSATPLDSARLLAQLARERFGDRFDEAAGVVRLEQPQVLRGCLADVPASRHDDPHVAFFLAANPGHAQGDELACLADLGDANLTAAGRRMTRGLAR